MKQSTYDEPLKYFQIRLKLAQKLKEHAYIITVKLLELKPTVYKSLTSSWLLHFKAIVMMHTGKIHIQILMNQNIFMSLDLKIDPIMALALCKILCYACMDVFVRFC